MQMISADRGASADCGPSAIRCGGRESAVKPLVNIIATHETHSATPLRQTCRMVMFVASLVV
jgi:hypothetical protein